MLSFLRKKVTTNTLSEEIFMINQNWNNGILIATKNLKNIWIGGGRSMKKH